MSPAANFFVNKANNDSKFQKDQELLHALFHVAITEVKWSDILQLAFGR